MSAPTAAVRKAMYERDGRRCVSCGARDGLQFQHRAAEGMGGRREAPALDEGLTSCAVCNPAYEGARQVEALRFGWKVRRWVVERGIAYRVPCYFVVERAWFLLERDGRRVRISPAKARGLMVEMYGVEYERWEEAA